VQFTIPSGTAGATADVTVTTPSGSITATGAFHYTAATRSYPVTANLQAGIYDAGRGLYYFTDQKRIQVFSESAAKWLSPIALPNVTSNTQLLAISESPDGTKLAVSDYGGQIIYVLNPDNPASATGYPMSLDTDGFSSLLAPDGLAVTNSGTVYFDTNDIGGTGTPAIHKLDTSADTITDLYYEDRIFPSSGGVADKFDRVITQPGRYEHLYQRRRRKLCDQSIQRLDDSISRNFNRRWRRAGSGSFKRQQRRGHQRLHHRRITQY
jgi:hypothetical protein